jgi:hypothetical protein
LMNQQRGHKPALLTFVTLPVYNNYFYPMNNETNSYRMLRLSARGVRALYVRAQSGIMPSYTFVRKSIVMVVIALAFALAAGAAEQVQSESFRAKLKEALSESQVDSRLQRLSDLATSLSLPEIPDALKAADGLKELRERIVLKQSSLQRWGELAPEEAFNYIAPLAESQSKADTLRVITARFARQNPQCAAEAAAGMRAGGSRNDAIAMIANIWAQSDVNNALAWAEKLPDDHAKALALDAIRYVWVHSDPVAASKDVEKLPPGITRNNLILNIAFEWAARDHTSAIQWVNNLSEGYNKDEALAGIAESWANRDPRAACAFALSLPPGEVRWQAGAMAASRWARQDPREAAAWAWNSGDAGVRQRGLKEVFDVWAEVDPAECAKWLEKLPAGVDRDQAARSFVTAATMGAPDIAAKEALLIENEATRIDAMNECLPRWLEVDVVSATSWLNTAKLPDPFKARLGQTVMLTSHPSESFCWSSGDLLKYSSADMFRVHLLLCLLLLSFP